MKRQIQFTIYVICWRIFPVSAVAVIFCKVLYFNANSTAFIMANHSTSMDYQLTISKLGYCGPEMKFFSR